MKVNDKEKLNNPLKGWQNLSAISLMVLYTVQWLLYKHRCPFIHLLITSLRKSHISFGLNPMIGSKVTPMQLSISNGSNLHWDSLLTAGPAILSSLNISKNVFVLTVETKFGTFSKFNYYLSSLHTGHFFNTSFTNLGPWPIQSTSPNVRMSECRPLLETPLPDGLETSG